MKTLLHPVALASLALLVINDHVLKAHWPGFVTGKLSDIAGMIIAPLFLYALVPRLRVWTCVAVVALAFALTKTWEPATHAYEWAFGAMRAPIRWLVSACLGRPVWSERIVLVRDPTDLVALPFGGVAGWIGSDDRMRRSIKTTLTRTTRSMTNAMTTRRIAGGFSSTRTRSG